MRPLYLKIKGFGPFLEAEITEEAFQLINQERLFLISGEIGAGKTTLFDAILYALFGEASFPDRTPKDLISHLLSEKPALYPEVTYKFLLDGKVYRIRRRPPYGKNQSFLALWINEKLYSERVTEVNLKIKEILGLEASHFKKVFILPQGEYRKILLAKPEERRELFELLFDTDFISRLEDFFKENLKEKRDTLASLIERERELLQLAGVATLEELKEKREENQRKLLSLEVEVRELQGKLQRLEEEAKHWERVAYLWQEYEKISSSLQELEKQAPEIEKLKVKVQKLQALKDKSFHYEHLKRLWLKLKKGKETEKKLLKERTEIASLLREKGKDWENLKAKEFYYNDLRTKLIKKEELFKTFQRRLFLLEEIKKLEREYQFQTKLLEELTSEEEKTKDALQGLLQEKEDLKKYKDLKKTFEELQKMENLLQGYHQGMTELESLSLKIEQLKEEQEICKAKYETLKERALAVTLARKLNKGEPCPVCGSTHHPKKATPDLFLHSTLDSLEREIEKREKELETLKKDRSQLEGKLSTLRELIKIEESDLQSQKRLILAELSSLEKKVSNFRDVLLLEEEELKLKEKVESLSREKEKIRTSLEALRTKRATLEGELKGLTQEETEKFSEESLKREILSLKKEIETFERSKEELNKLIKELERQFIQAETSLSELQRELKEAKEEYVKSLKEIVSLIRGGIFQSLRELKVYWEELKELDQLKEKIQTFEQERQTSIRAKERLKREIEALSLSLTPEFKRELEERITTLKEEREFWEEKRHTLTLEMGKRKETLSQYLSLENSLLQILKEKGALEEEYSILERIVNLLSGKSYGISFHSFVLSRFLGLILKRANYYLSEFSFGRYHFVEGEIFSKKFILEVFDNYTGQKREAKTLSGGESFLASLAFALGTSDTLLSLSKRGSLETLLIDEGFGSLDEGTLEKVTEILLQISQQRGKVVGIISHLRELRSRFPIILEVIKDRMEGSKIRLRRNY